MGSVPSLWSICWVTLGGRLALCEPEVTHLHPADKRVAEGSLGDTVSIKSPQPASTHGVAAARVLLMASLALSRSSAVAMTRWPSAPSLRPGKILVWFPRGVVCVGPKRGGGSVSMSWVMDAVKNQSGFTQKSLPMLHATVGWWGPATDRSLWEPPPSDTSLCW